MRNVVKILDEYKTRPTFGNLDDGALFRFPKGAGDNVYMKVFSLSYGSYNMNAAVFLPSGQLYEMDTTKEVEPISIIQITR